MRREFILLLVIFVGGCSRDQANDLAGCRKEADRFYKGYRTADVDGPRSQYIIGCMAAKGYDFNIAPEDCDSRHPLPTQPTCYAPTSWLTWLSDKFHAH